MCGKRINKIRMKDKRVIERGTRRAVIKKEILIDLSYEEN